MKAKHKILARWVKDGKTIMKAYILSGDHLYTTAEQFSIDYVEGINCNFFQVFKQPQL